MSKNCKQCSAQFEVTQEDLVFYDKISPVFNWKKYQIPPPTLCTECRNQRRLAIFNETKIYKRKSDSTWNEILSAYSADKPWKVYENNIWWWDSWDAIDYWVDFDFEKSFFHQMWKLNIDVPKEALMWHKNTNCDYCNQIYYSKDSYLCFWCWDIDSCLYLKNSMSNSYSIDCLFTHNSELCYDSIDCGACYNTKYSIKSQNCKDSYFLYACIWCNNCLFCANLRQKEYCIYNEQYSKEEYLKKLKELNFSDFEKVKMLKENFYKFISTQPNKFSTNIQCEDSTWDSCSNMKNCKNCFDSSNIENSKNIWISAWMTWLMRDCQDVNFTDTLEAWYEIMSLWSWKFIQFSSNIESSNNMLYCIASNYSKDCFWCIWLQRKQYCILNKQYTKEEYEILVPRIIDHMRKTPYPSTSSGWSFGSEWWEFFPVEISPFAYNETVAQEYFPMTKEEVLDKWWKWKDEEDDIPNVTKTIPAERLPDDIKDIPDDILNWAIKCEVSWRPFKVIPQELNFYREHNIPIPHLHPDERHKARMKLRNPRKLWNRKCDKCNKDIQSTYSTDREEIVYCEECYLNDVY